MDRKEIYGIPDSPGKRGELRESIGEFARVRSLAPPLSMEMLEGLAAEFARDGSLDPGLKGWIMVELNNAVWRDTVASIPHERRVLLLPKCLSRSGHCSAGIDEIGPVCRKCGGCSINDLEQKAADLGVISIVAEGFTAATSLIKGGIVDAVIGVSCLESLEKAFPLLVKNAVPGVAVPLNRAGCKDTDVDEDRVREMMDMTSDRKAHLVDYDYLDSTLEEWFSPGSLGGAILSGGDSASRIALEWMAGEGKRWRPYLLAATWLALTGEKVLPEEVKLAAMAVECFHKASLVHDDIQDSDEYRYGKKTVWARHGTAIAINTGDILLGEGYRLLALCGRAELTAAVSRAHISLCRGQGAELEWSRAPRPFTMGEVLDIFRDKTVPAFDVSLAMGVICAGGDGDLTETLHAYSEALGIAYQLKDDTEDFAGDTPVAPRPSAVAAAVIEQCRDGSVAREILAAKDLNALLRTEGNRHLLDAAMERVARMAADHRDRAMEVIQRITNVELKRLLFRVTERILG